MSNEFARVRDGKITAVRYSERNLRFSDTLAVILSTGDIVIPLLEQAPNISGTNELVFRAPTQRELDNKINSVDDLGKTLYQYDVGTVVAPLDTDMKMSMENLTSSITSYKGLWDPINNIPELSDSIGDIGDQYHVEAGHPNDLTVDLGSGPMVVRSGTKLEFKEGRWYSTGFNTLSEIERDLLTKAMVRTTHNIYDGQYGTDHGAYDIVSYPDILEALNGGIVVGQLVTVNSTREEMYIADNDGLEGLLYNAFTGEIYLNTEGLPPRTYNPTFVVAGPLGRSNPIPVRIDVLEYYLEQQSEEIIVTSGEVHQELITSPQDSEPELQILDNGGLWDVDISEDGRELEVDTFCCDEGVYSVDIQASNHKGTSDVLTVETEVVLAEGQPNPIWQQEELPESGLSPIAEDNQAYSRLDVTPIDIVPLDSEY